jgi:hypothetical protein
VSAQAGIAKEKKKKKRHQWKNSGFCKMSADRKRNCRFRLLRSIVSMSERIEKMKRKGKMDEEELFSE